MSIFLKTTHLTEILEESNKHPVIIFKYSSECENSDVLAEKLEQKFKNKKKKLSVFKITVQTERVLSNKITDWFQIQHESPQIIIVKEGHVMYTAHHDAIDIKNFALT